MGRGGHRTGAGRPSTWRNCDGFEDTKLIRVPRRIASRVLELAHAIDEDLEIVVRPKRIKVRRQQNTNCQLELL